MIYEPIDSILFGCFATSFNYCLKNFSLQVVCVVGRTEIAYVPFAVYCFLQLLLTSRLVFPIMMNDVGNTELPVTSKLVSNDDIISLLCVYYQVIYLIIISLLTLT